MDTKPPDTAQANIEQIKALFPEVILDGRIDFEKLREILGEHVDERAECYTWNWKGKQDAIRLARKPSLGALRPCIEESKNWDETENLYLEGDNLEVLKLLQSSYLNSIKMIYIDPPYNTGNDFVYKDDFADSLGYYKKVTCQALKSNPETAGRYHTNWLNMMYPRLKLARSLLLEDGAIYISIDDREQANLKKICDEIFGEDNFVATFPWRKRTAKSDVPFGISQDYEWILCYARSDKFIASIEGGARKYFETEDLPNRPWRIHDLTKQTSVAERPNSYFTIINPKTGDEYPANPNRTWAVTKETFGMYYSQQRIVFPGDYDFLSISRPAFRYFKDEDEAKADGRFGYIPVSTMLPSEVGMSQDGTKSFIELFGNKAFAFPKPVELIKYLVKIVTNFAKDAIILDFFSGSATTAHAVMQLNAEDGGDRKFIMVQIPEAMNESSEANMAGFKNICEIGKERIQRAGEKIKINKPKSTANLDTGFKVFKLDTSNLKIWDNTPTEDEEVVAKRIQENVLYLVDGRKDIDVVYEIMLKFGLPLTLPVKEVIIKGTTGYIVTNPVYNVFVCLQPHVTLEAVEAMMIDLPIAGTYIFADKCFSDANVLINAQEILKKFERKMRLF
jgi:adenine-specific DNA-methyltransferase